MSGGELPLPAIGFLDAAAKAAGYEQGWWQVNQLPNTEVARDIRNSSIAHARTLERLAKYERPPVDEAELKRRQDAREAAACYFDIRGWTEAARGTRADHTTQHEAVAAYIALCHRDNVTPVPVEQWGAGK